MLSIPIVALYNNSGGCPRSYKRGLNSQFSRAKQTRLRYWVVVIWFVLWMWVLIQIVFKHVTVRDQTKDGKLHPRQTLQPCSCQHSQKANPFLFSDVTPYLGCHQRTTPSLCRWCQGLWPPPNLFCRRHNFANVLVTGFGAQTGRRIVTITESWYCQSWKLEVPRI